MTNLTSLVQNLIYDHWNYDSRCCDDEDDETAACIADCDVRIANTDFNGIILTTGDVIMTSGLDDEYEGWNPHNPGGSSDGYEGWNPH